MWIDREARKGNPVPSDHAPLLIDIERFRLFIRCRLVFGGAANRGARAEGGLVAELPPQTLDVRPQCPVIELHGQFAAIRKNSVRSAEADHPHFPPVINAPRMYQQSCAMRFYCVPCPPGDISRTG